MSRSDRRCAQNERATRKIGLRVTVLQMPVDEARVEIHSHVSCCNAIRIGRADSC